MLALDRRASVRLQSQTNWRRAAVSFPWRRISGRSMAARPVQHLRQQMSLAARTRGRTRRTLGCYGRPPCPRRRCCGRFVSGLTVNGGRRRNEGAIATVMERRVLTMMGGRTAMMAYCRPQQRTRLSAVSSTAYAARQIARRSRQKLHRVVSSTSDDDHNHHTPAHSSQIANLTPHPRFSLSNAIPISSAGRRSNKPGR